MNRKVQALFVLAAIAVAVRLFALQFLHPLNWDEVEYFRATDWVRHGLVPFRDFWEHHTPLQWFVFAPFIGLTSSPGVAAVIFMRWMQVPLWVAAFWLINRIMQRAGIDVLARWTTLVLALTSSLLMISAVEYRVDILAIALYLAGVMLLLSPPGPLLGPRSAVLGLNQSVDGRNLAAGALFCLAGFANLRLGPLLAITVILNRLIDIRERRWGGSSRANSVFAGAACTLLGGLLYFAATDSLKAVYQHVWVDNYVGEKYAERVPFAFLHRVLMPFGIRIYGGGDRFQWTGIDLAGAIIVLVGLFGLVRALRDWRAPGILFVVALLQIANIAFIAKMKFVYHYHLQVAVLLMLPFVALAMRNARFAMALAVMASLLHAPIVLLRGKELELKYQDTIMREVHARTTPGAKVFDGVGWAIRREPAYRFWFLPVLARQLVANNHAPPLTVQQWLADPPAAVITDRNAVVWLTSTHTLAEHVVRHYLPVWRNLLVPALSARLAPGRKAEWIVSENGVYRLTASQPLANHSWFRAPFSFHAPLELRSMRPAGLSFAVNGAAVDPKWLAIPLKRGDRLTASNENGPVGIFLVPGNDAVWFRQPPPGVTIDAEGPRAWHLPRINAPIPTSFAQP